MEAFSKYYDSMVGADYDKIAQYVFAAIKEYKPDSELVCDLGCGTCSVAVILERGGLDMICIDRSEDMLAKAREKLDKLGICDILLLRQDMSEFELYGTVDVIYSSLDTLNYLVNDGELEKVFKLVRNYLNYGGLFIFDINTEYKFREILDGGSFVYDSDGTFCCWQSDYDKKTGICEHYLTYFEKGKGDFYRRFDEQQTQRFYSFDYVKKLAEKHGFKLLKVTGGYDGGDVLPDSERICCVMKINK